MSKKFTGAQLNYCVFEMETIAILEALLKWEDKLIGNQLNVVTNHWALEFFETQQQLSSHQMRWMEYLSQFDYDIQYIKGTSNKVADSLSRYYQSNTDEDNHPSYDYVTVDALLDPEGEDLPWIRMIEVCAMTRSRTLRENPEECNIIAENLDSPITNGKASDNANELDKDPTIIESLSHGLELRLHVEKTADFIEKVKMGYHHDRLFSKIVTEISRHSAFSLRDGLLYTTNCGGHEVLCIPRVVNKDYSLTAIVIDQAHTILGHFGPQKTADYVCRWYWWPRIGPETDKDCDTCFTCQVSKTSTQRPIGLLHSLPIPNWPWSSIGMDFIGPFPKSHGFNYLWAVICRLTSMVHLIPINTTTTASELASLYVKEIIRLHELPHSIVSNRDSKFTSKFWKETHRLLGTKLLMSTVFHPQTDGATEGANCLVGQILQSVIQPNQSDWVDKIPIVEFAINSNISSFTGFAPFELNYGYLPTLIGRITPTENAKPGIHKFINQAINNLEEAHDVIIES